MLRKAEFGEHRFHSILQVGKRGREMLSDLVQARGDRKAPPDVQFWLFQLQMVQ